MATIHQSSEIINKKKLNQQLPTINMDKGLSHEQKHAKPKNNQHLKTSNNNFETFKTFKKSMTPHQ